MGKPKAGFGLHALLQSAEAAFSTQNFARSRDLCGQILKTKPGHAQALHLLGRSSLAVGQPADALRCFERLTEAEPNNPRHWLNLAKVYIQIEQHQSALKVLDFIIETQGWNESVEHLRALCHSILGQHAQAIDSYSVLIKCNPKLVSAYIQLAALMVQMKQDQQAAQLLELALGINPDASELVYAKAKLLLQQGKHAAAIQEFERLEAMGPRSADQIVDHAEVSGRMKRQDEAERLFKLALLAEPTHHRALTCYARWLSLSKRLPEALQLYEQILAINPSDALVLTNMGNIYGLKRDFVKANDAYGRAFKANPQAGRAAGSYLYSMSFLCDWKDHARALLAMEGDERHERLKAFQSVVFQNSAQANLAYARSTVAREFNPTGILGPCKSYPLRDKIRIGYYSCDFYNHATMMLIEGLLQSHDRSRFELHAFSLEPTRRDDYANRVRSLFDQYHEVGALSDRAVTYLSRQLEIDIAIDLKGYTEGSRTRIFSERAAPLQVNYLGFPGTMGADFMDYMVADPYTITPENRRAFSEKIIYMPDCYQPNHPGRPKPGHADPGERPAELPPQGFVFCSFNNTYKINPTTFDLWLRILRQADQSVLWLLKTTPEAEKNILDYVARTDIDPARVIFARYLPEAAHLRRLAFADLFLDTFPCNAHTTASDAVWAGVPLITRSGETFASRVAGSILSAVGLPELIVDSESAYEALALKVYRDRDYHQSLKRRVKEGIANGPLYDVKTYTRRFEQALIEIHRRHQHGLSPQDLRVAHLALGDEVLAA